MYLYNAIEDEWALLNSTTDSNDYKKELDDCYLGAECFLFFNTEPHDLIFVTGKKISSLFINYYLKLVTNKKVNVLVVKNHKNPICSELIKDNRNFRELNNLLKNYDKIIIRSYAATAEFYLLIDRLKKDGFKFSLPESPSYENSWTVNFFGSKVGFRQLGGFPIPRGYICPTKTDAINIATHFFLKNHGVVIKTNKGSEGNGILIYRWEDLPHNIHECKLRLQKQLSINSYWDNFPIVVEELINVNKESSGGMPSAEGKILADGRPQVLYICTMRVTDKGAFYGVEINNNILDKKITAQVNNISKYITAAYAKFGYRGHFDIDFLIDKKGQVFANETNTRQNGSSDIAKYAKFIFGPNFADKTYIISLYRDIKYSRPKHNTDFKEILDIANPVLFSRKSKEGVIFNSELILKENQIFYTVFAHDQKTAYSIEENMLKLFREHNLLLNEPN